MNVGKLNRRIEIVEPVVLLDELGRRRRTNAWTRLAKVWAEVKGTSGSEPQVAKQVESQTSTVIRIRFRDDVTTQCRVHYRGRVLEIKAAIDQDGARREMFLYCGETT